METKRFLIFLFYKFFKNAFQKITLYFLLNSNFQALSQFSTTTIAENRRASGHINVHGTPMQVFRTPARNPTNQRLQSLRSNVRLVVPR